MNNTLIEWCDTSWNPITGCPRPKVSPGCANCYAERFMNTRLRHLPRYQGDSEPFQALTFHDDRLFQPLRRKKPSRVFVCSMSDLFHDLVDDEWIDEIFAVMAMCPQHEFFVLTKRVDRMKNYLTTKRNGCTMMDGLCYTEIWTDIGRELSQTNDEALTNFALDRLSRLEKGFEHACKVTSEKGCLPNVRLMATVCNQEEADRLIPVLLSIPGGWKFGVSVEPMLGPVDLDKNEFLSPWRCQIDIPTLGWVICGGETGPNARPMHHDWVISLRDQCEAANVPFFFKGWGAWLPTDQWRTEPVGKSVIVYEDGSVSAKPESRGRHYARTYAVNRPENALFYGEEIHEVPS